MKSPMKILSVLLALSLFVFPQDRSVQRGTSGQQSPGIFDVDLNQVDKTNEQILPQASLLEQAFETAIDPEQYILGPGDQLLISIWGVMEAQIPAAVSPGGSLIIPAAAEMSVSGKTLAEAERLVKVELAKKFKNANFSVNLVKMRKFRVFVVGEVNNPGTYFLRAVDRVSDAVQLARGIIDWGDDTRIIIKHTDSSSDTVNLSDFYVSGNLDSNPFLEGGDIIRVPPIDLRKNYAVVEGNVGSEGVYQFLEGETLYNFLTRLRAINRRSDIENVVLVRGEERLTFNMLKAESRMRETLLHAGDRIVMPSHRNRVYVKGEVFQPGSYPYLANYTARDYAGVAGILETAKGLESLYVIRGETGAIENGGDVVVQNGDIVVMPRRAREAFKDVLTILTPIISLGLSAAALYQASK